MARYRCMTTDATCFGKLNDVDRNHAVRSVAPTAKEIYEDCTVIRTWHGSHQAPQ